MKESRLKLSFADGPSYHTLRYDFKPASVSDEPAKLELNPNGQVVIKAKNVGGSSTTVFRGQRRPHVKECLLIIDEKTGEMVLQKLTDNITVKATRTGASGNGTASSNDSGTSSNHNGICNTSTSNSSTASITTTNNSVKKEDREELDGPQLSESSSSSDSDDESDSSSSSSSSSSGISTEDTTGFIF